MTHQQRNLFIMALVVFGIFGALLVFSSRPADNANSPNAQAGFLDVAYTTNGENRIVRLTKINQDVISGARFVAGSSSAKLAVVEFADYQCPACGLFANDSETQFRNEFVNTGKVRYAFRDFPLPQHQNAKLAAQAASCALEQGHYDQFKALLFAGQAKWGDQLESVALQIFAGYAIATGGKSADLLECIKSGNAKTAIEADFNFGVALGVTSTPTFVVADYMFAGALPIEAFRAIIKRVSQ